MAFPLFWAGVAGLAALGALTLSGDDKKDQKKKDGHITRAKTTSYNQKHVDEVFEEYEANGFDDREEYEKELRAYNERLQEQREEQQVVANKDAIKTAVDIDKVKAARLKDILCDLREVAGYSVDELSARIDVTRQTMYNWERKPDSKLSVPHYYALMTILAFQKKANLRISHDNILKVLEILVEEPEKYSAEYVSETRRLLRNLANELRNPNTSDDFLRQEAAALRNK